MNAPFASSAAALQLPALLPGLDWITDQGRVERLSRDFAWYSPVLERQLAGKRGDIAVRPRTEEEIRQVVSACAKHSIPITLRGSGTGNYGQCTPLQGGVVLDMSAYNQFLWSRSGRGRAQAGIRLAQFDQAVRPGGWELRWLPSTFRSATLGGLFGGGFGGAGSLMHGPLGAPGNILGLRAMTVEAEPKIVELRGSDALNMHHVYGTNGIVLELEVALAPAYDWMEGIATFGDLGDAARFGSELAKAPAIVTKEVALQAAPIGNYFTQLKLPEGRHVVLFLAAEANAEALQDLMLAHHGELSYCQSAEQVQSSQRTLIEYAWNHTTLQVLKSNKNLTNIQSAYPPANHVEKVIEMAELLGEEIMMHVEFLRTKDGDFTCSGLEIICHRDEQRLQQIMQIYRDHGVIINDPHTYVVEEGKNKSKLAPEVLELKHRFDPQGLLNPGKLRSWSC